ncbi:hypothetical protein LCGC14_1319520 [marine sediment metagenome]|uniref:HNH domain-containing protein n=1 Tax=marine sediment metagenome TaxID=412755 RepID=A0A0F9NM85_9ZZZZ
MIGKRFGRLVVIEKAAMHTFPNGLRVSCWVCLCDCGKKVTVRQGNLRNGRTSTTRSCGCLRHEPPPWKLNLAGQRFGKLVAIKDVGRQNRKAIWKCKCDCGNDTEVVAASLHSGRTKSCGCYRNETRTLPKGEAAKNGILREYKRHAKERKLDWRLTENQFNRITKENCFYCGVEPAQIRKPSKSNGVYVYNGIDRMDNTKGYTEDNCVTCCGRCNRAKDTMPFEEFVEWIFRVAKRLDEREREERKVG